MNWPIYFILKLPGSERPRLHRSMYPGKRKGGLGG